MSLRVWGEEWVAGVCVCWGGGAETGKENGKAAGKTSERRRGEEGSWRCEEGEMVRGGKTREKQIEWEAGGEKERERSEKVQEADR